MALALTVAAVAMTLTTAPAQARVDPLVPLDPFAATPDSCVVPALFRPGPPCSPLRAPERDRAVACNLPVLYLGGRPGPCPERRQPPESRVIPIGPEGLTR
jgi:hypothetical protein